MCVRKYYDTNSKSVPQNYLCKYFFQPPFRERITSRANTIKLLQFLILFTVDTEYILQLLKLIVTYDIVVKIQDDQEKTQNSYSKFTNFATYMYTKSWSLSSCCLYSKSVNKNKKMSEQ